MARRLYLRTFFVCAIGCLAVAAVLSYSVDPYGFFRPNSGGRATFEANIGQFKLYQALARQVSNVILGNSRADVGFDPNHSLFLAAGGSTHNLGSPGAPIEFSAGQLVTLCQARKLHTIVLGLDFLDFIRPLDRPAVYDGPELLRASPSATQYAQALFSAAALVDSARTLASARTSLVSRQTADGLNLMNSYEAEAKRGGYYPFFEQKINEYAGRLASRPRVLMGPEEASPSALREVVRIGSTCSSRLILILYPYHPQLLVLFSEANLWDAFEGWKRGIVREVAAASGGAQIVILDAARFNSVTRESLPVKGDLTPQRWYWESGHFKKSLGDLVLTSASVEAGASLELPAIQLSQASIDSVLASDREALSAFLATASPISASAKDAWRKHRP